MTDKIYQIEFWDYSNNRWVGTNQDPEDLSHAIEICEKYPLGTKQRILEREVKTIKEIYHPIKQQGQ